MEFSPQQDNAIKAFREWWKEVENRKERKKAPIFRLFGFAGTGKTTITKHVVEDVKGKKVYATFTGKAALVMRRHGMDANTLHSTIYNFQRPDKESFEELKKELEVASGKRQKELVHELRDINTPKYHLNPESPLREASLLVVDECSMVYDELAQDVESFNVPILILGDPGQLPPIKGTGVWTEVESDVMLTEIHRQARDNPIIDMATRTRMSQVLQFGKYGSSSVLRKEELNKDLVLGADQILAGYHKNRRAMNLKYRQMLGRRGDYPVDGEKVICLRNSRDKGLLNGLMGEVIGTPEDLGQYLYINFLSEDKDAEKDKPLGVKIHKAHFDEYKLDGILHNMSWWDKVAAEEFDFAYVITCHKAQGSQWDNVLVYDDGFGRGQGDTRKRWLYTAITRAVEEVHVVRG